MILPNTANAPGSTTRASITGEQVAQTHIAYTLENPLYGALTAQDGGMAGTDQGLPMNYLSAQLISTAFPDSSLICQAYSSDVGWCSPGADGSKSGVEGCQIETVRFELTGSAAALFDIYYHANVAGIGWKDWTANGELAGTAGGGCPLQAVSVVLVRKGRPAPGAVNRPFMPIPRGVYFRGRGILVSIPLQTIFVQDSNGKIVFISDCITGHPDAGYNATPYGNYSILAKSRNVYLSGSGYYSHVDYWIPFIGSTYGFHDASWREDWEYNGSTYLTDPSHGCVNMRLADVARFSQLINIGDPVYVR